MTRTRTLAILRALLAAVAIGTGACAAPTAPTVPASAGLSVPGARSNSGYTLASCDTDSASVSDGTGNK